MTCQFVPPYLPRQIASSRSEAVPAASRRRSSTTGSGRAGRAAAAVGHADRRRRRCGRQRLDGAHRRNRSNLPVRWSAPPVPRPRRPGGRRGSHRHRGDAGALRRRLPACVERRAGGAVSLTLDYRDTDYDNAFWDGTEPASGDGDGTVSAGSRARPTCSATKSPMRHRAHRRPGRPGPARALTSRCPTSSPPASRNARAARGAVRWTGRPAGPSSRYRRPRAARHGRARHGVRRPDARQGPAGRRHGRLRRHHRRRRRRAPQLRHPQPGVPARRDCDRRPHVGGRRRDLVRRAHRPAGPARTDFAGFAAATIATAGP